MASFIWKPSTINSWKGGVAFLAPDSTDRNKAPTISAGGQTYTGRYINTNEGRHQWVFPKELAQMSDLEVSFGGQTGKIGKGYASYEGGDLGSWAQRAKGSLGDASGGSYPGGFAPGSAGEYGVFPAYLGDQFPTPYLSKFRPIKDAPFNFTDPGTFAKEFGGINREEMRKNLDLAKTFSLDLLENELKGLQGYVPGAAALKRQETALDNVFNQMQREQQVEGALPGVRGELEGQRDRAQAYAEGRVPDDLTDRMLELTSRSRAADLATAGGFGARSRQASRLSDLMSAETRINLSRYGDQLLTSNIGTRANLFLAPTQYSNAGSQISVMPSLSPSQLATSAFSEINRSTLISPETALTSKINQEEFRTNLTQRTNEFNAQGKFSQSQINTGIKNNFALTKFQYMAGYAAAVAGAAQTNINTGIAVDQQKRAEEIYSDYLDKAQAAQTAQSIASGISSLPGIISGIAGAVQQVGSIFKGDQQQGGGQQQQAQAPDSGFEAPPEAIPSTSTTQGATNFPSAESVPSGYTPIMSNPDGSVAAVPDGAYQNSMASFSQSTGIEAPSPRFAPQAAVQSSAALANAGISSQQYPGFEAAGVDSSGRPVFSNAALASSSNAQAGATLASTADNVLRPLGVFEGGEGLNRIAETAGDVSFIAQLTDLQQRGDMKGFVETAVNGMVGPISKGVSGDPQNQAGVTSAFTAYNLAQNWERMSPAQKSLGLATLGIQGYKFGTGENLAEKVIPGTKIAGTMPLKVGQALAMFQAGYNVYSMVKNWDQLNTLQKVAGGAGTAASVANAARQMGLLGSGTQGAAVAANASQLTAAGFQAAPSMGIGAISGPATSAIPSGYVSVGTSATGDVVAIPAANAPSATAAQAGSLLGTVAGVTSFALGAQQVYKNWGTGGKAGAVNGALGGSAMAGGLYALGATNPFLLGGVVAVSVLGGMAKTGKSADQQGRDAIRSVFQKNGLADNKYQVSLSDGTKVDVGIDGGGGRHSWADKSRRVDGHSDKGDLHVWDIDYTNDMDFSSGMMGTTLSRLMSGGRTKAVDQLGGQLGNAGLGNVGYGKEMTSQNFDKVAANFRGMFAQAGIKSKADAYALVNQGFAEGRWKESDAVSMHQAINMAYDDNGYATAQKLMSGRWRGADVAVNEPVGESPKEPVTLPASLPAALPGNKPVLGATESFKPSMGFNPKAAAPVRPQERMISRTPEIMKIKNRKRYASQQVEA